MSEKLKVHIHHVLHLPKIQNDIIIPISILYSLQAKYQRLHQLSGIVTGR